MKRILKNILLGFAGVALIAGAGGAIYGLTKTATRLKDSNSTSSKVSSSTSVESSEQKQTSSSAQTSESSVWPEPLTGDFAVSVDIEQYEYSQSSALSELAVPMIIQANGYDDDATLEYYLIGFEGDIMTGITVTSDDETYTGSMGNLDGPGRYVIHIPAVGYDHFTIYQMSVSLYKGTDIVTDQAKFCANGPVSENPYQGTNPQDEIKLCDINGNSSQQYMKTVQSDPNVANTAHYYVVAPSIYSSRWINVTVTPANSGDVVTMRTKDFGSSTVGLTVLSGTEITFLFETVETGYCQHFYVNMSYQGFQQSYEAIVRNYGLGFLSTQLVGTVQTVDYDPDIDGAMVTFQAWAPPEEGDLDYWNYCTVTLDSVLSGHFYPRVYQGNNSATGSQYDPNPTIRYLSTSIDITIELGHLDPGVEGSVTVRCYGVEWTFAYVRHSSTPEICWSPETIFTDSSTQDTYYDFSIYIPPNMRSTWDFEEGELRFTQSKITGESGNAVKFLVSDPGNGYSASSVNWYAHGDLFRIMGRPLAPGGCVEFTISFYYGGNNLHTITCHYAMKVANAHWETIFGVMSQSVTYNGGTNFYIGLYFEQVSASKKSWLEVYVKDEVNTFSLVSNDFAEFNNVSGNRFPMTQVPTKGKIGIIQVFLDGTLNSGNYEIWVKHYYTENHPEFEGSYETFAGKVTVSVS